MGKRKIRVGSRDSRLAVIQSRLVMEMIEKNCPDVELELVTMKTTGDMILDKRLDKIGGKGLFVKELDRALADEQVDITVHSMKDLPMEIPKDLPLVGFTKREAPFDGLVLREGQKEIDLRLPLGTSSLRREVQLRDLYPDWKVESIRGNLQTRLRKLDDESYGGIILACAGLVRLGLEYRIRKVFTPDEMIPAAGQGIIAIQGRAGENYDFLKNINDVDSEICGMAERAFVSYLDGGCSAPIGAFAELSGEEILIRGLYSDEEINFVRKGSISGPKKDSVKLAEKLAKQLKEEE